MGRWLTRKGDIEPCVYLPGEPSRYEVIVPTATLSAAEVDELHGIGARRSGWLFYRPACPNCQSCLPLRVPGKGFQRSRSQRRGWTRNSDLRVQTGAPVVSAERVDLYNKHLFGRDLNIGDDRIRIEQYESWLVDSGIETVEFQYLDGDRLLGVGLIDLGAKDASSVYFFFDPEVSSRSLGTFSLLTEIDWLTKRSVRYHYLGFYNERCAALAYKVGFRPNEILLETAGAKRWQLITEPSSPA